MKDAVGVKLITGAVLRNIDVVGSMRTSETTFEVITLDRMLTTVTVDAEVAVTVLNRKVW